MNAPTPLLQARERQELVREVAQWAETAPLEELLGWAHRTFGARLAVAASMQEGLLPQLAAEHLPQASVLFLDTGYHFPETLATRDAVAERFSDLRLVDVVAQESVPEQDAHYGPRLHERDPDLCCALRKTAPLNRELRRYDAWVNGVRRVEAPTRAGTPVVGYDAGRDIIKISPLAGWSDEELETYLYLHNVEVNPLTAQGYPSIGCAPCTRKPAPGADPRSGRWAGSSKTECGIHL